MTIEQSCVINTCDVPGECLNVHKRISTPRTPYNRVRIVKNELGGSATQQELRGCGVGGFNGMNRGTGGLNPQPSPRQFEPYHTILKKF